jgi:hypothetical protein
MTDEQYSKVDKELRELLAKINYPVRAFQSRDGSIFFAAPGSSEDEALNEDCKLLGIVQLDMVPETAAEKPEWKPGPV